MNGIKRSKTDHISVYKAEREGYIQLTVNHNWFKDCDHYSIKDDGYALTFLKHYLDVPKNAHTVKESIQRGEKYPHCRRFTFKGVLPLGTYQFCDEESTEDKLVVYYQ